MNANEYVDKLIELTRERGMVWAINSAGSYVLRFRDINFELCLGSLTAEAVVVSKPCVKYVVADYSKTQELSKAVRAQLDEQLPAWLANALEGRIKLVE